MRPYLFVTGMPRSGTTLVDKIVSLHPAAHVLSQPLPLLYVEVKRAFLSSRNGQPGGSPLADRYPLNDMFGANYYPPAELVAFLDRFRLSAELCRRALEMMIPFGGQYTKPERPLQVLRDYRPARLWSFIRRYTDLLVEPAGLEVVGSKESYCEEYIPYLLSRGARVLLILRDPRDVVTSLNCGRGTDFGGQVKPLVFNIRQWRKSVAFALAQASEPGFLWVRYEDLVRRPHSTVDRIFDFLGLERCAERILAGELRTQSGETWRSNSSHFTASRITDASVGRYRKHLPRAAERLIQACCLREMRALGYEVTLGEAQATRALEGRVDAEPAGRPELAGLSWNDQRRAEERTRLEMLRDGRFDPKLFVFESAFSTLRAQPPS